MRSIMLYDTTAAGQQGLPTTLQLCWTLKPYNYWKKSIGKVAEEDLVTTNSRKKTASKLEKKIVYTFQVWQISNLGPFQPPFHKIQIAHVFDWIINKSLGWAFWGKKLHKNWIKIENKFFALSVMFISETIICRGHP